MDYFIEVVYLVFLIILAYQDFKQREISWFLIPVLAVLQGTISIRANTIENATFFFLINSGFIILQIVFLTLYFSLKNRKFTNVVNTYLGAGDIWFFFIVALAFSPVNFILFYLGSLILTLIGFLIWKVVVKNDEKEIPLAGAMAIGVMGCRIAVWVCDLSVYRDVVN